MRRMWLAYVGVTLLGALVGVAIAGIPSGGNEAVFQISPVTDTAPVVETSQPDVEVAATATAATTTTLTVPPSTTAEATSTSAPRSTSTTTSTTSTTSTTTVPLPERSDVVVVAVNGANVAGLAGRTTELLTALGYARTRSTDGTIVAETTVIYFADGRLAAAERLAADIGLENPPFRPIDDNVPFNLLDGDELVVYAGLDRA